MTTRRSSSKQSKFQPFLFYSVSENLSHITFGVNILFVLINSVIVSLVLFIICYPTLWGFLRSLQQITVAYITIGWLGSFAFSSVALGIAGLYALRKKAYFILGVQTFALAFLIVLEASILYTIIQQWLFQVEVGVTFAVQSFKPGSFDDTAMNSLQEVLRCCGRGSNHDYAIANEMVPVKYVPFSCCDINMYELSVCYNHSTNRVIKSTFSHHNNSNENNQRFDWTEYFVPTKLAYKHGCVKRLNYILLPIVISLYGMIIMFSIITTIMDCLFVQRVAEDRELEKQWRDTKSFIKNTTGQICLQSTQPKSLRGKRSIQSVENTDICVAETRIT